MRYLVLFALMIGSAHAGPRPITFGYNPSENNEVAENNGKRFSKYFKEKLGREIRTFIAGDYTALVEAMRGGQLDFAWMPPFSFVKAESLAGAVPLMKSVYSGRAIIYGGIIVRKDRGFKSIEDLKGKNIAWVDPSSASGHIFPRASLLKNKSIDADKFFGKQIFAGGHDAVVMAVVNGTVDAGATYMVTPEGSEGGWLHYLKEKSDMEKIQVLFVSDPIPSDLVTTTKKFQTKEPELVKKMVEVLAGMHLDPVGKKLLRELYKVDQLTPADTKDYEPVREASRVLKLEKF
jgi:phosphonate transport system substrate-binding protein